MLGSCDIIAFVGTKDLVRARRFYRDVLGLRMTSDEHGAAVFDAHGTMLRVTEVGEVPSARYTILGWTVPDIQVAIRELTSKGVTFDRFEGFSQDSLGVWTAPDGTKVAWFRDPDGNMLSVTEF